VGKSFDDIANSQIGLLDVLVLLLQPVLIFLAYIPTKRTRAIAAMHAACGDLAKKIVERTRTEEKGERSIMGLLSKSLAL
jgi:hypothetical protein